MASIFTYDPDPPRVSSPWLAVDEAAQQVPRTSPSPSSVPEYGVTKLQAEPQEGPTEYKLHLLLRPRRTYTFMSTSCKSRAPQQGGPQQSSQPSQPPIVPAASNQPRHERLKHLTTQLLWRLQQSSPYHASSSKELIMPRLPEDSVDLHAPVKVEALVPGLEESRGALYEIGVSDDGTLVGLTKDEMSESIATLRVMAASLGCSVEVVRMVIVGDCEWIDSTEDNDANTSTQRPTIRKGRLWAAEALVTPNIGLHGGNGQCMPDDVKRTDTCGSITPESEAVPSRGSSATPQLRITLTGPTTSGKSTLLGTLSSGMLDNGRGKSRLSLLRHRHEMVSGVTSSIAQELIGYREGEILNFSQGNIESWVDIHDCAESGRLVFISDSGGHPRYRRTVLRGLMSRAPHWSVLCIAADAMDAASDSYGSASSECDALSSSNVNVDLVKAHLTLSLKLDMPIAVVITKLDLASKMSLQKTMIKVLTAIKEAGRIPKILQPDQKQNDQLQQVPLEDQAKVDAFVRGMANGEGMTAQVPIVLTSAVKGTGIGLVHALLASLPVPSAQGSQDHPDLPLSPQQPTALFHIDDTFSLPSSDNALASGLSSRTGRGVVVSGHIPFGRLSVGDRIVIGPFQPADEEARGLELSAGDRPLPGNYGLSISHPSSAELARVAAKNAVAAANIAREWHHVQIVSIRNLRLPVRALETGQAGSIGLVLEQNDDQGVSPELIPRIRRGMVLAPLSRHMLEKGIYPQAASGFVAVFSDVGVQLLVRGSFVNVYFASVRAAARVVRVRSRRTDVLSRTDDAEDIFTLAEEEEHRHTTKFPCKRHMCEVTLELLNSREWMDLGSTVLLMEGGRHDRSGLEGYAGKVVEISD
ncbi:hypothetical protein HIM_09420 [Hirsutella minnesotensis 3608]|uniref:Tr-type G domain-containing protein n=1 Tax=Hirsutella minnesotensis 3608 TaxID=1043627 RepID=A0A0F8A350_9HYPO|nr:hypothetical protein HIM_09420 [Hirsutella minnesotensis 3608]